MKLLRRWLPLLFLALASLPFAGCGDEEEVMLVRFYLETEGDGLSSAFRETLELPRSDLAYEVRRDPVILERNIIGVDLVRVESGRLALRFQLDDEGRRNLYRYSVSERGQALVLTVNSIPVGVRQLDGPIADGVLYTFTELPPDELEELAVALQDNVQVVAELKEKRLGS